MATTILLADDHTDFLSSAVALVRPHFEVVAAVGDGRAAVEAASRLNPELVVLDIAMPKLNGIEAAGELKRLGVSAKVVFLSMHEDEDYVSAAFSAGALGYVFKSRLHTDLLRALHLAATGQKFLSPPHNGESSQP